MIEKDGWELVSTTGSHRKYKHPSKPGQVIIPHPRKDIPKGTANAINKASVIEITPPPKKRLNYEKVCCFV